MDFGQFVSAFDTGYRALRDKTEGVALTKPMFCRDLLCAITDCEDYVIYENGVVNTKKKRDLTTFQAYYRNTDRRSLHPIAALIVSRLDTAKFVRYLYNYSKGYDKYRLLSRFITFLPDTNIRRLFGDITREFVNILTNAAAIQNEQSSDEAPVQSEQNSDKTSIQNEQSSEGHILQEDLLRLKQITRQLCIQIDTLRQLGCVYHYEQFIKQLQDEKSANDKKVREYRKEYELFSVLDKELHFLCRKNSGQLVEKVKQYTNTLDEDCFITRFKYKIKPIDISDETNSCSDAISKESVICAECDPDVELYYDALIELSRSLDNLS